MLSFFAIELTEEQRNLLGANSKKTIIFEAELLALVISFAIWQAKLETSSLVSFIDNNSSRDVAISGVARSPVAGALVEFLLKLEMSTNITPWYTRVPTCSNVADEPSRGELEKLLARGVPRVDGSKELLDILAVLKELVG